MYEPLIFYNGSCATCTIPWLASSYTASPSLTQYNFTLRSGISFADGEPLNSTAVYFSLNRLLVEDSSTPTSHGTEASWLLQQLLNESLSSVFCNCALTYNQAYVNEVLAQNFVQITGDLTFTINVMHPSAAFAYLLAGVWGSIIAPNYVMNQDMALWNVSSNDYTLPYAKLSGNLTNRIYQYFVDEAATCNSGVTPGGCAQTYLDESTGGSLAGTGPYILKSFSETTSDVILQANPNYWGGPYQFVLGGSKIVPKIPNVEFKYVPDQTTRELDLKDAASSGQAMAIDVSNTNIYDVANRTAWLDNNRLESIIPGVSIYGPYTYFGTYFGPFATNVTNAFTGAFYSFQPFADVRFRLAFADSVNMTDISVNVNNNLGSLALNVVPPGIPPAGSWNSSITPAYSYNPDKAAQLLLSAMQHPITHFTFTNGSAAPPGLFNNTFGCATLGPGDACSTAVPQSIPLYYREGDVLDGTILTQIATTINNISSTYNMGLTVSVVPLPNLAQAFSTPTSCYMYIDGGYEQDYPWVLDFLGPMYAPDQSYTGPDGWNISALSTLFQEAEQANSAGNVSGLIKISNQMNIIANQMVMYLWTFNTVNYITMTSNVQGFYYNPSLNPAGNGGVGPEYFATLY